MAFVLNPALGAVRDFGEALPANPDAVRDVISLFFPPAVSLTLLAFATLLSVFKPWGRLRRADRPAPG